MVFIKINFSIKLNISLLSIQLIIFSNLVFAMAQVMNNTAPTGGEHNPIDRLSTSMIPNCNSLMPNCMATGKKIGVKIRTAGVISKNAPTTISSKLISSKIRNGLSLTVSNALLRVCGMFSKESSHDIAVDAAMSSITMAVVSAAFNMIPGNAFSATSL